MRNLRPCPFCGGKPVLIDERLGWAVRCDECKPFPTVIFGVRVTEEDAEEHENPVDWEAVKQSAIDAWNRRI